MRRFINFIIKFKTMRKFIGFTTMLRMKDDIYLSLFFTIMFLLLVLTIIPTILFIMDTLIYGAVKKKIKKYDAYLEGRGEFRSGNIYKYTLLPEKRNIRFWITSSIIAFIDVFIAVHFGIVKSEFLKSEFNILLSVIVVFGILIGVPLAIWFISAVVKIYSQKLVNIITEKYKLPLKTKMRIRKSRREMK